MNQRREGSCGLLSTLSTSQPVNTIVVDGYNQAVSKFVNFEEDTDLAYFSIAGGGLIVADCRRISLIEFP